METKNARMTRKLEFDMIYYAYLNKSPFKYYISILGGVGGLKPCLLCLFRGGGMGGPEFGETCLYNTCTLPNGHATDAVFWLIAMKDICPRCINASYLALLGLI